MAAIVGNISMCDLKIEVHCRTKPALYKSLPYFKSHLKQLYLCNKMGALIYKGGCVCNAMYMVLS